MHLFVCFLSGFSMLLCNYLGVLGVTIWLLGCSWWFLGYCYSFVCVFLRGFSVLLCGC